MASRAPAAVSTALCISAHSLKEGDNAFSYGNGASLFVDPLTTRHSIGIMDSQGKNNKVYSPDTIFFPGDPQAHVFDRTLRPLITRVMAGGIVATIFHGPVNAP